MLCTTTRKIPSLTGRAGHQEDESAESETQSQRKFMNSQVRNIQLKSLKYSVGSSEDFGLFPKVAALTPKTKRVSRGCSEMNGITKIFFPGQKLVLLPDISSYLPFRSLLRHIC